MIYVVQYKATCSHVEFNTNNKGEEIFLESIDWKKTLCQLVTRNFNTFCPELHDNNWAKSYFAKKKKINDSHFLLSVVLQKNKNIKLI